jgi:anti-sigma factor RsiW
VKDIERMVISAHEDGEVESPWKEKVAEKLASDAEWAAEADRHRRVKTALARDAEPDFAASLERVKARLEGTSVRKRVLRLPALLTAAAAALLVLAAGGGFWLGRQAPTAAVAEISVQVPKQLPLKLSGEGQLIMASTLQGIRP